MPGGISCAKVNGFGKDSVKRLFLAADSALPGACRTDGATQ
jgi:hypothetical protein